MLLDAAAVYFERPGVVQQVAHPHHGGDVCTAISLPGDLVCQLTGDEPAVLDGPIQTDGPLDLAHRALVARLRRGERGLQFEERVVRLLARLLEQRLPERVASGRPATAAARRRAVDVARAALAVDPASCTLLQVAALASVSPHHLSRVFHEETGHTLSRHRSRLQVRLALERIDQGERSLAVLAAELGFADQAHLTRTMRREIGQPPAQVRRLFADAA
jgi:AraC-like DNA-binding protein